MLRKYFAFACMFFPESRLAGWPVQYVLHRATLLPDGVLWVSVTWCNPVFVTPAPLLWGCWPWISLLNCAGEAKRGEAAFAAAIFAFIWYDFEFWSVNLISAFVLESFERCEYLSAEWFALSGFCLVFLWCSSFPDERFIHWLICLH